MRLGRGSEGGFGGLSVFVIFGVIKQMKFPCFYLAFRGISLELFLFYACQGKTQSGELAYRIIWPVFVEHSSKP